jgi:threonine synthase
MNRNILPVQSETLADSIAVDYPRDGERALRAIKESDGFGLRVSDEEIVEAMSMLARLEGVFAEPAAAAAIAGLKRALSEELLPPEALTVALITGHGLKDSSALSSKWEEPKLVEKLGDLP